MFSMQNYAWAASFRTRVLQSVTESCGEVSVIPKVRRR